MKAGGRILFVTEKFPWPIDDGGQIRTWHVLANVAAELPVTLLALSPPDPAHVAPARDLGIEVLTFPRRRSPARTAWYASKAVFTHRPYPLEKNASRPLRAEIERRVRAGGVLALHLNHLDAAQYVETLPLAPAGVERVRTVFDTHNLLTRMYERLADAARDPVRKGYCTLQAWKMARYEREILKRVDKALVCSDVEREQLHTWGVDRALVVPNGVDTVRLAPNGSLGPQGGGVASLVFVGALGYLPNEDGLRWFFDAVAPELERKLPGFRLTVVGKDAPPALLARARPGRVEFTGYVDDVRPHVHAADVAIVPLRIGGGTRLKILDAMALGRPVVSTTIGAEGILARPGRDLLVADSPADFAQAVLDACTNERLARELAENGRKLVLERYDWKSVVRPLVEHYLSL
jgi:glycosyltransferase involved in cell wall biosynthesis